MGGVSFGLQSNRNRRNDGTPRIMKIHLLTAALILPTFTLAEAEVAQPTPAGIHFAATRKPEISVNSGFIIDGKSLLEFFTQRVGVVSDNEIITIDNIGTANLTGLKLVIDGPGKANFKVTKILKTSLSPNLSTSFRVKFQPSQKKPAKATLHILSNDADEKSFDIKLIGSVGVIITPFAH